MQPTRRLVSFFFVDRAVCTLHAALFSLVFSPPAGSPSPDVDKAACFPHTVSFSLFFFIDGAVCTLHAVLFSFIHSAQRPSSWEINEAACIPHAASFSFFFFIDGGGTRPHSGSFPPNRGDSFFFRGCIVNGGGV